MKTQHTQGPWKANTNLDSPLILSTSTKRNIAYIAWSTEQSVWESKANATLIAAAPELLEALEAMLATFEPSNDLPVMTQARTTIAKARGKL